MMDSYVFMAGEFARSHRGAEDGRAAISFLRIQLVPENTPQTLHEMSEFLLHPGNVRSIPQVQGAVKLAKEIGKSDPEFINRLPAVVLNNLKLAPHYAPRHVNSHLLHFRSTLLTADL